MPPNGRLSRVARKPVRRASVGRLPAHRGRQTASTKARKYAYWCPRFFCTAVPARIGETRRLGRGRHSALSGWTCSRRAKQQRDGSSALTPALPGAQDGTVRGRAAPLRAQSVGPRAQAGSKLLVLPRGLWYNRYTTEYFTVENVENPGFWLREGKLRCRSWLDILMNPPGAFWSRGFSRVPGTDRLKPRLPGATGEEYAPSRSSVTVDRHNGPVGAKGDKVGYSSRWAN